MRHIVWWVTLFQLSGVQKEALGPVAQPNVVISFSRGDRQDVINKTEPFEQPPFKSYHFPCLFHVVQRGWGASLHTQDLKNTTI